MARLNGWRSPDEQTHMAIFRSFLMGGFECSTHKLRNGRRLDLVASTRHDRHAEADYARMQQLGILTAREGLRWHLIEERPHRYNFQSFLKIYEAAASRGVQVLWDLLHYGWPEDIDVLSSEFIERFQSFSRAFASFYRNNCAEPLLICPVNEISFLAWGGGDTAYLNPYLVDRGNELKRTLVQASLAASDAVWEVLPKTTMVQIDPVIHIAPNPKLPARFRFVNGYNEAQYAAWDMLAGRLSPELGGASRYLDILGVNYYPKNQWLDFDQNLTPRDERYRPFREILREVADRYGKPIFVAETGTEDNHRPFWFRYIVQETVAAIESGVNVQGLCLYPILNHPGWLDDRHCHNGLWDYADEQGEREIYEPLREEIERQRPIFETAWQRFNQYTGHGGAQAVMPDTI